MKKASTTAFFLCCALYTIIAQTIEIPDNNFLQALIELGVDSNKDNLISQQEAAERPLFHHDQIERIYQN